MRWICTALLIAVASGLGAETPLYWAIANNDALEVWNLTSQAVPPTMEENGLTPPAWAVERGSGEAMDVLTWRGLKLDQVDERGRNLLFPAAARGRLDLFEKIEAAGARIDQVDRFGLTLVHAAAQSPHPVMLQTLLARGLPALTPSALGVTPLMEACLQGRIVEAATLLEWGANPEDEDYLGRNVRSYAVAGGDPATLALIEAALTPWTIELADEALPPSPE